MKTVNQLSKITGLSKRTIRYYDPEFVRFISADEMLGRGYNLFEYCHNHKINFFEWRGSD